MPLNIFDDARAFAKKIVGTDDGEPVTVRSPIGDEKSLKGIIKDVHQYMDPGTGTLVSGRQVSVTLSIGALKEEGFEIPWGEADPKKPPWIVSFTNSAGETPTFKVKSTKPDRTLDVVVCELEHVLS